MRYLLVAPPKSNEKPEDVNYIKPLAANEIAPGDTYGASALPEGKGEIGTYLPSGLFDLRLDSVRFADDAQFDGNPPDDGKRFVVMTITAKSMTSGQADMGNVEGDGPSYRLFDADGNEYQPIGFRKPKTDEEPEKDFKLGGGSLLPGVFRCSQGRQNHPRGVWDRRGFPVDRRHRALMTTQDDVRRIVSRLPETVENQGQFGYCVIVKGKAKGICWSWMERVAPKKARIPNDRVLAVVVPNLEAKELLLASRPEVLFTEPHYNNYPAVLVCLELIEPEFLEDLLTEAWRCKAAKSGRP